MSIKTLPVIILVLYVATSVTNGVPFSIRSHRQCGQYQSRGQRREAKIVGGYAAFKGEFPWIVSFKSKHGHFCGGTVISDSQIVGAAHCFYKNEYLQYSKQGHLNLHSLNVTLGEYSLKNRNEPSEVLMSLKSVQIHPNYDPVSKENDIAIIEISKEVSSVAPDVIPVCLPGNADSGLWTKDARATVVGWGKLSHTQDYYDWLQSIDALQKVEVNIWDREACKEKYRGFPKFPSTSFLCAGREGKESCTGDSGGPLLRLNNENKWVIIGIVANGNKCGAHGRPGVYTLVSDFMPWISELTR